VKSDQPDAHRRPFRRLLVIVPALLIEPGRREGDALRVGDILVDVTGIVSSPTDDVRRIDPALQCFSEFLGCWFSRIWVRRP
jgi:hypothetical protein